MSAKNRRPTLRQFLANPKFGKTVFIQLRLPDPKNGKPPEFLTLREVPDKIFTFSPLEQGYHSRDIDSTSRVYLGNAFESLQPYGFNLVDAQIQRISGTRYRNLRIVASRDPEVEVKVDVKAMLNEVGDYLFGSVYRTEVFLNENFVGGRSTGTFHVSVNGNTREVLSGGLTAQNSLEVEDGDFVIISLD